MQNNNKTINFISFSAMNRILMCLVAILTFALNCGVNNYAFAGQTSQTPTQEEMLEQLKQSKLKGDAFAELHKYVPSQDYYIGVDPSKAKVVIIEYGSFTCPHCAVFYLQAVKQIKEKYIDKGRPVSFIYRSFVSDGVSLTATMLLKCIKPKISQSSYQDIIHTLYKTQSQWIIGKSLSDVEESLEPVFELYGMSPKEQKQCLANAKMRNQMLTERITLIEKGGLYVTPMILVNYKEVAGSSTPVMMQMIDDALDAKTKTSSATAKSKK